MQSISCYESDMLCYRSFSAIVYVAVCRGSYKIKEKMWLNWEWARDQRWVEVGWSPIQGCE